MIDIPIKKLFKRSLNDWLRYLMPEIKNPVIRDLPTEITPKSQSKLDSLYEVKDVGINGEFILHIEPQGYRENSLPHRMLRYRADMGEHYASKNLPVPSIRQIVVLFSPEHDNHKHRLTDSWDDDKTLEYRYTVIKLWEIKRSEIKKRGLTELAALFPFMQREEGDSDESVFAEAAEIIKMFPTEEGANDLLGILTMFCENKLSKKFFKKFFTKEQIMKSEYLTELFNELAADRREEWTQEGEKTGILKGEKTGILKGEKTGLQRGKLEMARNLYELGVPFEKIVKAAKMPKKTIQKHLSIS